MAMPLASVRCIAFLLLIATTSVGRPAHADIFGCAPTSVAAFHGGAPKIEPQNGDQFTFDTVSGIQRYVLADTPAARFATPKGHVYARRLEVSKGDRDKAKAIIDEMMADKDAQHHGLEFKFDILSSKQALSLSAASKSCVGGDLCFGRFLTIRLPGEVRFQGQTLKIPVPAGTYILVEGNTLTVSTGECKIVRP